MTIKEIKDKHATINWCNSSYKWVEEAMIEYSEIFARKCLEKASEEVEVDYNIHDDDEEAEFYFSRNAKCIEVYALKHSITDIELPKHE